MAEDLRESLAMQIPPLSLAYVGDSIYDFFIRDRLIRDFSGSLNKINSKKKDLVCAKAQSDIMEFYLEKSFLRKKSFPYTGGQETISRRAVRRIPISETTAVQRALRRCWGIYIIKMREKDCKGSWKRGFLSFWKEKRENERRGIHLSRKKSGHGSLSCKKNH